MISVLVLAVYFRPVNLLTAPLTVFGFIFWSNLEMDELDSSWVKTWNERSTLNVGNRLKDLMGVKSKLHFLKDIAWNLGHQHGCGVLQICPS